MREIEYTKKFEKEFARFLRNPRNRSLEPKLFDVIESLRLDLPLSPALKDHPLKGGFMGMRECHLRPNVLLVYQKIDSHLLKLVRLGSHSTIFGS